MIEALSWVLAAGAGLVLGAIFFGGLWFTVRKALVSTRPALWFFGSLLLRMTTALGGMYLVGHGHWERLLACLAGFIVARFVVTWVTRTSGTVPGETYREVIHAP